MKKLTLLFSFVTMLVLAGCTKPLELPPEDAGFHFKHYQRVKLNANHPPWVGSEIDLKQGERVLVLASGKVTTCRRCGSDSIDQPPNRYLYMRIGESTTFFSFSGKIAGMNCFPNCGYYQDFKTGYDGELQLAVRDWGPGPTHKYIKWYTDNSGSFLLDVFVYDLEQKEGFKRFLRAMIQNNPEDLMFTAQAQAFLK